MKRFGAQILCILLLLSMSVAGCGSEEKKDTIVEIEIERAEDILVKVWASYEEKEKFNAVGGNVESMAWGFPCEFSVEAVDEMEYTLAVPSEGAALLDNAASLSDEMDPNTFTSGAFCLKEEKDVNKFAKMVKETLTTREWAEDSEADKYVIAKAYGKNVIVVYGEKAKVDTFKEKLVFQTEAKILHEGNIK